MKKLSLNNKPVKVFLIILTVVSCLTGVVGAFFKIQPVYYTGMGLMGVFLILNVIAFVNAAKEDKLMEIEERYEEAKKSVVFADTDKKEEEESADGSGDTAETSEPCSETTGESQDNNDTEDTE